MIVGSSDFIVEKLVAILATQINAFIQDKGKVVVGVVGGRSVSNIFKELKKQKIQWDKLHIGLLDERFVDRDDAESNFKLLEDVMREVPGINLYPIVADTAHAGIEEEYTAVLKDLGGSFNIILLSSGEDGHIAALFPNHPVLQEKHSRFVRFADSPKPPSDRITVTPELIKKADVALLMFMGEGKREALKLFLSDASVEECPAKLVDSASESYVFTDIAIEDQ